MMEFLDGVCGSIALPDEASEFVDLSTYRCTRCTYKTQDEDAMMNHIWDRNTCDSPSYTDSSLKGR